MKPFNENKPSSNNESNPIETTENYLKEALQQLKIKNFKELESFTTKALITMREYLGTEILKALPTEFNGFKSDDNNSYENVNPGNMYGFDVVRHYSKNKNEQYSESILVTFFMDASKSARLARQIDYLSTLDQKIETEKIVEITPTLKKGLGRFSKSPDMALIEIPCANFYITIEGYGTQCNETSLANYASKLDFEALSKIINGI